MPDPNEKVAENAAGPFYVTDDCIGCGVCLDAAPENFKLTEDDSQAFVSKQPGNDAERALCQEALEDCPAEAIGSDGA